MTATIRIRSATTADAAVLARHRARMFVDMGRLQEGSATEREIVAATERMLAVAIPSGEWTAWIAEADGAPVGGIAALLRVAWPNPRCPGGGTTAYLLNAYVEPAFRRRGVATALVRASLDWCGARDVVFVDLHASAEGRAVYERLGFVAREGEMRRDPGGAGERPASAPPTSPEGRT